MKILLSIVASLLLSISVFSQTGIDTGTWFLSNSTYGYAASGDVSCNIVDNASASGGLATFQIKFIKNSIFCRGGPDYVNSYPSARLLFTGTWMFMRNFSFTYPATIQIVASMPGLGDHAGLWMLSTICRPGYETNYGNGSCASLTHYEIDFCDYLPGSVGVNNCQFARYGAGGTGGITYALTNPTQLHTFTTRWTSTDLNIYLDGSGSASATITANIPTPMFILNTDEVNSATGGFVTTYPLTRTIQSIRVCNDSTVACNAGDPTIVFEETFTTPSGTTVQNTKIEKATQQ